MLPLCGEIKITIISQQTEHRYRNRIDIFDIDASPVNACGPIYGSAGPWRSAGSGVLKPAGCRRGGLVVTACVRYQIKSDRCRSKAGQAGARVETIERCRRDGGGSRSGRRSWWWRWIAGRPGGRERTRTGRRRPVETHPEELLHQMDQRTTQGPSDRVRAVAGA